MYHQQLSYCVTQFVEKDPGLAEQVLMHILEYWPRTFSAKEVIPPQIALSLWRGRAGRRCST